DIAVYTWQRDELISAPTVGRSPGLWLPPLLPKTSSSQQWGRNNPEFLSVLELSSDSRAVNDLLDHRALVSIDPQVGQLRFTLTHPT
ncbi:unnamed protein product, partial [Amoebophrya sp. A25]